MSALLAVLWQFVKISGLVCIGVATVLVVGRLIFPPDVSSVSPSPDALEDHHDEVVS